MEITALQKRIVASLQEMRDNGKSLNDIVAVVGTNKTSVSDAMNGHYAKIGEAMWKEWQAALRIAEDWKIFPTTNYNTLRKVLEDALEVHKTLGITAYTGSGKTTICEWMARNKANVYYVMCDGDMTPRELLVEIQDKMKLNIAGSNSRRCRAIAQRLNQMGGMLILDEFSSVTRDLYYTAGTIVKLVEYYASVVLVGTEYLKSDFEACVKSSKRGMSEIERRFCKNWVELPNLEYLDVVIVCQGNGITDKKQVRHLFNSVRNFGELRDMICNMKG